MQNEETIYQLKTFKDNKNIAQIEKLDKKALNKS